MSCIRLDEGRPGRRWTWNETYTNFSLYHRKLRGRRKLGGRRKLEGRRPPIWKVGGESIFSPHSIIDYIFLNVGHFNLTLTIWHSFVISSKSNITKYPKYLQITYTRTRMCLWHVCIFIYADTTWGGGYNLIIIYLKSKYPIQFSILCINIQ